MDEATWGRCLIHLSSDLNNNNPAGPVISWKPHRANGDDPSPVASDEDREVLLKAFEAKLVVLTHITNLILPTMQPFAAVTRLTPENSS